MSYSTSEICDDIGTLEWVPIETLRDLANISLMINFNDTVLDTRDKIRSMFSNAKRITSKTTRFPEHGIYCYLNHPSLRDNFAELLFVAQNPDLRLRLIDSVSVREKLFHSLNQLAKVVYSLSEKTKTMDGFYNRKTFESTFQITWE